MSSLLVIGILPVNAAQDALDNLAEADYSAENISLVMPSADQAR